MKSFLYGSVIFKYIDCNKVDELLTHFWVEEYMLLCYGLKWLLNGRGTDLYGLTLPSSPCHNTDLSLAKTDDNDRTHKIKNCTTVKKINQTDAQEILDLSLNKKAWSWLNTVFRHNYVFLGTKNY